MRFCCQRSGFTLIERFGAIAIIAILAVSGEAVMGQTQTVFREDFEEQGLKEGWEWIDPQSDCERTLTANKGWLRITVRGHHDLWPPADNFAAPRLLGSPTQPVC